MFFIGKILSVFADAPCTSTSLYPPFRFPLQRMQPRVLPLLRPRLRHRRQDLPERVLHGAGELQGEVPRRGRQEVLRQVWPA